MKKSSLLIPKWKQRTHDTHMKHLKSYANQHFQLAFLGDSLIEKWLKTGQEYWNKSFSKNSTNLGVGGDGIEHLLYRIVGNNEVESILDVLTADRILLMIGTNNLEKHTINRILEGIINLIKIIFEKQPETQLIIYGLLDRTDINLDKIAGLNTQLEAYITQENNPKLIYRFFGDLVNKENKFFVDNVHLSKLGYEKWASSILEDD